MSVLVLVAIGAIGAIVVAATACGGSGGEQCYRDDECATGKCVNGRCTFIPPPPDLSQLPPDLASAPPDLTPASTAIVPGATTVQQSGTNNTTLGTAQVIDLSGATTKAVLIGAGTPGATDALTGFFAVTIPAGKMLKVTMFVYDGTYKTMNCPSTISTFINGSTELFSPATGPCGTVTVAAGSGNEVSINPQYGGGTDVGKNVGYLLEVQ